MTPSDDSWESWNRRFYRLVGKEIVQSNYKEWESNYLNNPSHILWTTGNNRILVSTVFLGMDHNWLGAPPILFETLIFHDGYGEECWRYHTYDEAEEGHKNAVAIAFSHVTGTGG